MDFTIINDLYTSITKINQRIENNRQKTPGTMNIAELMNRHHLENQHSNIISFLLDPNEKHNHKEYGELFLDLLRTKGLSIQGTRIISVKREDSTDEARRMDLFIETDSDYIIIENKIFADDQQNQIEDYLTYVKTFTGSEEDVYVVYLSPFGKVPAEKSISREKLNELLQQHKLVNLSYSEDLLKWLGTLTFKDNEEILQAGIIQYIDVVKAITNQRKETFSMKQEIAKELFNEYGSFSREQLRENLSVLYEFQNNINLVLFINFFEDIYKEANGKILLLCNNKDDYKSLDEWKNDVIKTQEKFGVRYYCNNLTKDLFVRDLKSNKFVFGCKEAELENCEKPISYEGYVSADEPTSWFTNALLALPGWDWEKKCKKKLATHVVQNWFNIKD